MKVLCVGADPLALDHVQLAIRFRWPDAKFHQVPNGYEALTFLESEGADLVVAATQPEDLSTSEFCSQLREFSDVALIVVDDAGPADDLEEVKVLEAGADEYIRTSTGLPGIVARIAALMRRIQGSAQGSSSETLVSGDLTLNSDSFEAFVKRRKVELTPTEFNLLRVLARHRNTIVRHEVIERALWGDVIGSSTLVKKYVHRLRQKLADVTEGDHEYIRTVYSIGYLLVDRPHAESSDNAGVA